MSFPREQDGDSPTLEAVIQKLEESLLRSDGSSCERSMTVQGDGEESVDTPMPILTHIRHIITRSLVEQPTGESSEVRELEQSRALRELPSPSQMDHDQLSVKNTSLTERLQAHLDSAEHQRHVVQDLNTAFQKMSAQLQKEQRRCASLTQVNAILREQLEQGDAVNKRLAEKLTKAHEDSALCATHISETRQTYASLSSREQACVRALWRQAASLRSTFTQLRTFTDRTLSHMCGEFVTVSQQLRVECLNLEAKVTEERPCSCKEMSALEMQLKDRLKEAMQHQAGWDAEKVKLNSRILELTDILKHLQSQSSEKDSGLNNMQLSLDRMETRRAEDKAEMAILHKEIHTLQKILCRIYQLVSREGESSGSKIVSSSTLHGQSHDLAIRLESTLKQVATFLDHIREKDAQRIRLEQIVQEAQRECREAKEDSNRYCCSLKLISNEKANLEKLLSGLQQEVDSQCDELEELRSSSLDLQRQRDLFLQQREDLEIQLACQCTEAQRGERSLQELEGTLSDLRKELITVKEALSQITLQKELLEDDKASLTLALTKAKSQIAAKECSLTKLQNEEAALKDSIAKMAALSEGLAEDKVELNRIVLQIEGEKMELGERRRKAEFERAAAREDAAQAQKEIMNLLAEKKALESSHIQLKDLCQKLETELSILQKEKAGALEEHSQVKRQMQTLTEELCACRKELEARTTAIKRAAHDREELAKDKAALDVKLNSAERKACGLTQELVALRAEKKSLETTLFESQELSASLEAECTRLEAEWRSLILTNEALTREWAPPSEIPMFPVPSRLAMKPFQPPTRDPYFSSELCNSWAAVSWELLFQLTRLSLLHTNTHGSDISSVTLGCSM